MQEVSNDSHPLPSLFQISSSKNYALIFIGELLSVWAFSLRRTDSGVGIGSPVKSLPPAHDKVLGFDHQQQQHKEKTRAMSATFCRHDPHHTSSWLLAIPLGLGGDCCSSLFCNYAVTKSRLFLVPRLNTQASVHSQRGDPRKLCSLLGWLSISTTHSTRRSLSPGQRPLTVFPFPATTSSLGPWRIPPASSTVVMGKRTVRVNCCGASRQIEGS